MRVAGWDFGQTAVPVIVFCQPLIFSVATFVLRGFFALLSGADADMFLRALLEHMSTVPIKVSIGALKPYIRVRGVPLKPGNTVGFDKDTFVVTRTLAFRCRLYFPNHVCEGAVVLCFPYVKRC